MIFEENTRDEHTYDTLKNSNSKNLTGELTTIELIKLR